MRGEKGNIIPQKTLESALELLHFETVSIEAGGVFKEEKTLKPYSVYKTTKDGETLIDFSFVDADGITHFATFSDTDFVEFARQQMSAISKYIAQASGEKRISADIDGFRRQASFVWNGFGKAFY